MSASSAPNQSWPPITPPIPQWLHQNVLRVLPTLDVLLFAIDVTSLEAADMKYVKRELDIMLQVSKPSKPNLEILPSYRSNGDRAIGRSFLPFFGTI